MLIRKNRNNSEDVSKLEIIEFIKNNYTNIVHLYDNQCGDIESYIEIIKINNKYIVNSKISLIVKNKNIESLTNGLFIWDG